MPENKLDWHSQGPDIKSIKNLFAWLEQSIIKRAPKNIKQIEKDVDEIWENIDAHFLKNY